MQLARFNMHFWENQARSSIAQHSTELVNYLLLCCLLFATGC